MRTPSMKTLLMTTIAGAMTFVAINANAWPMWTSFKAANIDASARVIDYSDPRAITTSEGQSYAMFFALVLAGVGFILSWLLVGFAVWMVGFVVMGIWVGYRILRGWIRLSRGQTMPV